LLRLGLASDAASDARPHPEPVTEASPMSPGIFVPPTPQELAARLPQFEILELLGRGGMGAVYKARQKHLDRLVAVKILSPEVSHDPAFAERFAREARALARLNHPHIVGVYDFGQTEGLYFLVMEFVDGLNLRRLIAEQKGLTPANALAIVPQICDALQFAHDEGIVHRDIKPENILIDKKGRVKIADFGLAKLTASGERASPDSLTGTHQVMGTLRYMAPEQMEGSKQVDHRADIYSLGVVFYELLTGELPMGRFAPPSKKAEIDVRLDEVVLRALEKEPAQRWQQASEVKTEVETISRTPLSTSAPAPAIRPQPVRVERPRSLQWKKPLAVWGGLVLLLAIVAALIPSAKVTHYQKHSIFIPQSGAYSRLLLGGKFQSIERGGVVTNVRPSRWTMEIETVELDPNIKRTRKLEFPTPPQIAYDGYFMPVLDPRKEDPKVAAEMQKVRFFVENYFSTPENLPASWDEFHQRAVQALQPNFQDGGFDMPYHGVEDVKAFWPVFGWGTAVVTAIVALILASQVGRWPVIGVVFLITLGALIAYQFGNNSRISPSLTVLAFVVLNLGLVMVGAMLSIRDWLAAPDDADEKLQRRVRGPAIAMIIIGSLGIIACLVMTGSFILVLASKHSNNDHGVSLLWAFIAGSLLALASRIVTVFAGVQLINTRGRGWGIASSILLLLPTDPLAVIAIPLGIWGLSTLLRNDVARALAVRSEDAPAGPPRFAKTALLRWSLLAIWTLLCIALYVWLWFPVYPSLGGRTWPQPMGHIDRWYWPYYGEVKATVTLIPKEKTFRQLTITNHRTIERRGFENGHSYFWMGPGHRGERTLDDYSVEVVDTNGQRGLWTLTLDGMKGLRWYYGSNPSNSMRTGTSFNVEDALDWLRDCRSANLPKTDQVTARDDATLRLQAKAWVEVILHAAGDSGNIIFWKGPRQPVGHLAYIVGQDAHSANSFGRGDFPWEDYLGTEDLRFGPVIPIIYVGIPVMVLVWLVGVVLIRRCGRKQTGEGNNARTDSPVADAPGSPKHWSRGKLIGLFVASLLLVGLVLGLVWATVGWAEAAVWASLTWLATHGLLLLWLPRNDVPTTRRLTRAVLIISWTLACTAVYFTLWLPDAPHSSSWTRALGYIDRCYWPYDGKSVCSVTLTPVDKTFRQLTITNERAMRRYGYGTRGVMNWSGPGWPGERTKDQFTVTFVRNDGLVSLPLEFNGIGKQDWSYTEFGTSRRHKPSAALTVEGAIAWLEFNGVKAADRKALEKQTKSLVDLLYLAASQDDASGGYRGPHRCVGYLDFFVGRDQLAAELKTGGVEQLLQPGPFQFPWADHVGTHEYSFGPAVPILYVGLPLMIVVWLVGLFGVRVLYADIPTTHNGAWADHWRSVPRAIRLAVHIVLALVYLICLTLFFAYTVSRSTVPDDPTKSSHRFAIGQPSPWFEHHSGAGNFGSSINLLAWSNLAALIGLAALFMTRKLERIERGKVHSIWWHWGVWSFVLLLAIAVGVLSVVI